jgi:hypothetical protein
VGNGTLDPKGSNQTILGSFLSTAANVAGAEVGLELASSALGRPPILGPQVGYPGYPAPLNPYSPYNPYAPQYPAYNPYQYPGSGFGSGYGYGSYPGSFGGYGSGQRSYVSSPQFSSGGFDDFRRAGNIQVPIVFISIVEALQPL